MTPWQAWDEEKRWELLSTLIDGELSEPELTQVMAWLDHDPDAQQMLRDLQAVQRLWQQCPYPAQPSEPVIEAVMQRVYPCPPARRRRSWTGTVAASLSILAISGGLYWRFGDPQPLVSLDSPPVTVTLRPSATQVAETYLLTPPRTRDPFVILFQDEPLN